MAEHTDLHIEWTALADIKAVVRPELEVAHTTELGPNTCYPGDREAPIAKAWKLRRPREWAVAVIEADRAAGAAVE